MRLLLVAALGLSACATMSGSGTASASASCEPATANDGAVVYSAPDPTSTPVVKLSKSAHVCADADAVGFGFRKVKLDDGQSGYLAEKDISG